MALKIARRVTCTCGVEFETKCGNKWLCDPCQVARKKMLDSAWYRDHKAHLLHMRRVRRAEGKAKRLLAGEEKKPFPAREVPCYGGCGAMVLSTNRNGTKCCPECSKRKRAEANYKYRHSEKGKAWQAAANLKKSMDPELQARKRERARQEILAKNRAKAAEKRGEPLPKKLGRPPKPKPPTLEAKPRAVRAIKPTAEAVAPVQEMRLPTEADKLAMLRAAMKRYYGG